MPWASHASEAPASVFVGANTGIALAGLRKLESWPSPLVAACLEPCESQPAGRSQQISCGGVVALLLEPSVCHCSRNLHLICFGVSVAGRDGQYLFVGRSP